MKLLFWCLVIIIAAVLASFAASNRETIALALWPLPFVADLPLYLAMLGALAAGVVLGVLAMWVGAAGRRREARRHGRRIVALERELTSIRLQPRAAVAAIEQRPAPLAQR
jgi:lipopolysaccharide assembly protein A